jgi:hypothetical protein
MTARLQFSSDADRADTAAFLARVVRLDPAALTRVRSAPPGLTLWAWLPLEALVARTVRAACDERDVTIPAKALLDALTPAPDPPAVALPGRRDADWRGALPADGPGELLDEIPAEVISGLLKAAEQTFRTASEAADPKAVGDALLDHEALTVSGGGHSVAVPLRGLLAGARMGFYGTDPVRVAVTGGWVRLGASYGAVYLRRNHGLALFPAAR